MEFSWPISLISSNAQLYTYYNNATALSAALNGMALDSEGSLIVGKTSALEKVGANKTRLLAGAGYNVEKFSVSFTNAQTTGLELTRQASNNLPFIRGGANTKCISGMSLGN